MRHNGAGLLFRSVTRRFRLPLHLMAHVRGDNVTQRRVMAAIRDVGIQTVHHVVPGQVKQLAQRRAAQPLTDLGR
jgi:hypothetical protein